MVAEAFGALFSRPFQGGLMEGFPVGKNGIQVSHLQFVDNILFFARIVVPRCCISDV